MSARVPGEHGDKFGIERALGKMGSAGNRLKVQRAREIERAANIQHSPRETAAPKAPVKSAPEAAAPALEAWPLPGLAPMTRVRTSFGDVHAAALRKGDQVLTRSGEYLPIQWLTRIRLDEQILVQKPDCNPVSIAAGALGPHVPMVEIMLSPRQILCADEVNTLVNDVEAARLVSAPGIRRLLETSLSYTMFHVGKAAEVYCEGLYLQFPMDA